MVSRTQGVKKKAHRILVRKPERNRSLGRPRSRWKCNIKMDVREIKYGGIDWSHLIWYRDQWRALVKKAVNILVPQNVGNFLNS
jgi:hypothetical protein